MTTTKEVSLYDGKVNITFYPDSHRYKLEGEKTYLISVTSCTGMIDKSRFLIPWAVGLTTSYIRQYLETMAGTMISPSEIEMILDEAAKQHTIKKEQAADIGHQVHAWCEKFAKAKMEETSLPEIPDNTDPKVVAGINAFMEWYTTNNVKFMFTERMIYSRKHKYVGLADFIANVNGKVVVGDYKTGKNLYTDAFYQIAAYREAYNEEQGMPVITGSLLLHFDKETGEFRAKEMANHKKDFAAFKGCLAIKKREKELATY